MSQESLLPRNTAALSLVLLMLSTIAVADTLTERADAYLFEAQRESELPGVSAAIMVDGELVWSGGAGYRDVEAKLPADGDMLHRIASITKSLTATAIMQLEEEGKLRLKDPVRKHVQRYPKKEKGKVTVFHLLTHTSGMKHYFGKENRPFDHYETLDDALEVFQDRTLAFAPGVGYLYTTYGYTTLGAVIEGASGQSYEDYMREHIWEPSGMTSTRLEDQNGALPPDRAKLYRRDNNGDIVPDDETDLSIKYPGGGLLSTAPDLVRFLRAFQDETLISHETMERMFAIPPIERPRRVPYALGWIVSDHPTLGRIVGNDGGQSGTSTNFLICRDHGVSVAVLSNVANAGREVAMVARGLAAIAAGLE